MAFIDETETLTRLGLTNCQAKIYLTLVQSGKSSIKAVSKKADIPRESVYRAMPVLEKMSLVERMITKPTMYKAIPIGDGISILMELRAKETCALQKKTTKLIENLKKYNPERMLRQEEAQLILISGSEAFGVKASEAVKTAQNSFDGIATPETFRWGMLHGAEGFVEAVKRGVKFRHIVCKTEKKEKELGDKALRKNPLWEVRYILNSFQVEMIIFDKKEVFIAATPNQTSKISYLQSTSPCLVALAQNYYETLWRMAKDGHR